MASLRLRGLCAAALAMALCAAAVAAAAPASPPVATEDCTPVITELVDCLPFVTGSVAKPPATCCSNLTAVITDAPTCLCQLFNTSFTGPLGVNVTRAEQLPPACNVSAPAPSLCALIGIPVAAPTPSSTAAPAPTSPAPAPTPIATSPSPSSVTPSVAPAPSVPSAGPVTAIPPSANVTTATPPGPPSGASTVACSLSILALLLLHLVVHS